MEENKSAIEETQRNLEHFTRCHDLIKFAKDHGWTDAEFLRVLYSVGNSMNTQGIDMWGRRSY